MENVISTLVWAALIQGVLLATLYLFSRKHRSVANRLLGLFLLVIVYEGTLQFQPYDNIFGYSLYYFALPEVKLFYPVLFLHYILEKIGRTAHYRKFLQVNYILAVAIAGISLVNVLLFVGTGLKIEDQLGKDVVEAMFMAQQYYAFLLIVAIFIMAILELRRYSRVVQSEYSDYAMLNINWLWRLILVILPIIIVWGANLAFIALGAGNAPSFELATWGFVIIFLYFVSFQAFKHKNLFEDVPGAGAANDLEPEPDSRSGSYPAVDKALIQRIRQHMESQEPYLDASLSIYQLATQLKLPVKDLSLLINHTLNQHFFDFVNEYRIKKAMEFLRNPQHDDKTVLEILYEVGFNSKSSFNTVFKKFTGTTPTEYRRVGL